MIYLEVLGGLCNRMRTIASFYAFMVEHGIEEKFTVIWTCDSGMNCQYDNLFQLNSLYEMVYPSVFIKEKVILKPVWILGKRLLNGVERIRQVSTIEDVPVSKFLDRKKDVYIRSCHQIYHKTDFSIFEPHNRYVEKVNEIMESAGNRKIYGIHIRRSDNEQSIKHSPIKLFVEAIQEELDKNPYSLFYLASDDKECKQKIKSQFMDAIITQSDVEFVRNSKEGIECALLDLMALSRCEKIYGSYYSSFSEVAAKWGGTKLVVLEEPS